MNKKMKILLTHRFFWPDTAPYATILKSIGDVLAAAGHEVHVVASIPSYRNGDASSQFTPQKEMLGSLNVNRIWVFQSEKNNILLRIANVIIFTGALFYSVLRKRPDVVSASTFPPVIAAWSASLAAKLIGARFIYHVQDIHPEISRISGGKMGGKILSYIFEKLDNQTLTRSHRIVVLSEDMADTLKKRGIPNLPINIINNVSLEANMNEPCLKNATKELKREKIIIFAGNLGRFQNLIKITQGLSLSLEKHRDMHLIFLGDGEMEAELKLKWGSHPQISFLPFLPFSEAKQIIQNADIGIVSILPGIQRAAYPSKIVTYLSLGLPVLLLADPNSGLAKDLTQLELAEVPVDDSAEATSEALERLLTNLDRSKQIAHWQLNEGSTNAILKKWIDLVAHL